MVIASSYPLLEVFWTMLIFFGFVVWVWILFTIIGDLFRRHDTTGVAKVLWILFILIAPYLGVFVYLVVNHTGMAERGAKHHQAAQEQLDRYMKSIGAHADPAERIARAKGLLDDGTIDQSEFEQMKKRALAD
jgi:hypothetical protein